MIRKDSINKVFGGVESRFNVIVEHLDGKVFDLYEYGVVTRDFIVSSPEYSRDFIFVDGGYGGIEVNKTLEPRKIALNFWMRAEDGLEGYVDLRDFVYSVFGGREYFYVTDSRKPTKRWLATLESEFAPEQNRMYGFFTINLYGVMGLAESSTFYIQEESDEEFVFNNLGNVDIVMSTQETTEIEFKGSSDGLTITNETTGDVWSYKGVTEEGDVITLKGVRSTKNGVSIFSDTNKKLLTFAPGRNIIKVTGASEDFALRVKTRWYFL